MSTRFANIISYLFHPLLFPTYGTVLLLLTNHYLFAMQNPKAQFLWIIVVFIMTFVFPVVWLVAMKQLDMITSFKLDNPKERIIPYIATGAFYMWTYKQFSSGSHQLAFTNPLISMMMLGAAVAVFIGFIVNVFTKISLHAIGAGCMVGLTLSVLRLADFDLRIFLIAVIVMSGLIGSARIILGAHSQREVYIGYMAGFAGQFFSFSLMPMILNMTT